MKYGNDLKLDSPRTKKILQRMGIVEAEVELKKLKYFKEPGVADDIAEIRWRHHNKRVSNLLATIIDERRKLGPLSIKTRFSRKRTVILPNMLNQNYAGPPGVSPDQIAQLITSHGGNPNFTERHSISPQKQLSPSKDLKSQTPTNGNQRDTRMVFS
jgi:hypothetical protein